MNSLISFLASVDLPLAESAAGAKGDVLSTGTAVLGLVVVALIFLTRSVVNLRSEVEELKAAIQVGSRPVAAPQLRSTAPADADGAPSSEEMVVIAAAVAFVFGSNARLISVGPAASTVLQVGSPELQVWSREGRRQVFQSHQVR